jgi:hypothetical protein
MSQNLIIGGKIGHGEAGPCGVPRAGFERRYGHAAGRVAWEGGWARMTHPGHVAPQIQVPLKLRPHFFACVWGQSGVFKTMRHLTMILCFLKGC